MATAGLQPPDPRFGMEPWNRVAGVPQARLMEYGNPVSEVPIFVTPSGKPAGSLSYAGMQARIGAAILVPQPSPSPLQQWIREDDRQKMDGAFSVGAPVQLCHLTSPEARNRNRLTGDIRSLGQDEDGSLVFEVLCPTICPISGINLSKASKEAVKQNRRLLASEYGLDPTMAEDENYWRSDPTGVSLPPYVVVGGVGSEKLDPKSDGSAPAAGMLPALKRPPIWGPPLTDEEYKNLQAHLLPKPSPPPSGTLGPANAARVGFEAYNRLPTPPVTSQYVQAAAAAPMYGAASWAGPAPGVGSAQQVPQAPQGYPSVALPPAPFPSAPMMGPGLPGAPLPPGPLFGPGWPRN